VPETVDSGRQGDSPHTHNLNQDTSEHGLPFATHETAGSRVKEDEPRRAAVRKNEAPVRISFKGFITLRRIKPETKRKEYVKRLEGIVKTCEKALADPNIMKFVQLKAAQVIIEAIRMSYTIVREVDVENLEKLTAEISAKIEERDRASPPSTRG
jgi:hypothetical protein